MSAPVDLVRARAALAALDKLAAAHPERLSSSGPKWAQHLTELDTLTMATPVKQRIKDYRARLREKGYKAATLYLPAGAPETLARLAEKTGLAYGDIVALALDRLEKTTDTQGD